MNLRTLRARARQRDLQVEDILGAAKESLPGLADELDRLTSECSWTDGGETPTGRLVPLRKWAITASTYCRSGYAGLVSLAREDASFLSFVLALLAELQTPEAVTASLALAEPVLQSPATDLRRSLVIASTFNLLLSFSPRFAIAPSEVSAIRGFLHRSLLVPLPQAHRATVLCALRGVGDIESLQLVVAGPPLPEPWSGLEASVRRAIKKRLRHGGA